MKNTNSLQKRTALCFSSGKKKMNNNKENANFERKYEVEQNIVTEISQLPTGRIKLNKNYSIHPIYEVQYEEEILLVSGLSPVPFANFFLSPLSKILHFVFVFRISNKFS